MSSPLVNIIDNVFFIKIIHLIFVFEYIGSPDKNSILVLNNMNTTGLNTNPEGKRVTKYEC